MKTTPLAMTLFLGVLLTLAGCAVDETTSPSGSGPSIVERVTYKPFAESHTNKFSLGDFDSPYLLLLEGYTNFVASNSSILLNNITHEVVKTNYQGGVYVGIDKFSFGNYTSFLSTNDTLTIKVNLLTTNKTYTLSNETIAMNLTVTKATNLYTWQDLQGMKHNLNGDYMLRTNITFPDRGSEGLAAAGLEPVGNGANRFTGSFAGGGHTIANLSIDRGSTDNVGIWGFVESAGIVIKDFVVDHSGIKGADRVGAVVGNLVDAVVNNVGVVSSKNSNVSGNNDVGGLVGSINSSSSAGSVVGFNTSKVSGTGIRVGGLVGQFPNGAIVTGYATGAVSGDGNQVGGLVGWGQFGTVTGYATGAVSGDGNLVGGLMGQNSFSTVTGYATGRVSGAADGSSVNVGGLVGENSGTVNSYWDQASSEQMDGFGANSGTFNGVGISRIANVVFTSTNTYWDNKGTPDATDDVPVFNNPTFLMHFTLPVPGAGGEWPTLKAEDSFPSPPSP